MGGFLGCGGGGGQRAYQSKNIPTYEDWASSGIGRRAGITQVENPEWTAWNKTGGMTPVTPTYDRFGHPTNAGDVKLGMAKSKEPSRYSYDTSQVGAPISRDQAVLPYQNDLNLLGKANSGFQNPTKLSQTYDPYHFDGLPEKYGDQAFASGSRDIRRQGQGDLEKIQETVGVRRPGLLLKAGQKNQRDVSENLAKMRTDIDLGVMDKKLATDQAQAGENYKGYESRANLEKGNADETYRYLQGLQSGAATKVGLESGITQQDRTYHDDALKYLMNLYLGSADAMKSNKPSYNFSLGGDK